MWRFSITSILILFFFGIFGLKCFVYEKPHNFRAFEWEPNWKKKTQWSTYLMDEMNKNAYKIILLCVYSKIHRIKTRTHITIPQRTNLGRTFPEIFVLFTSSIVWFSTALHTDTDIFCLCFHWFYRTLDSILFRKTKPAIRAVIIRPPN